MPETNGIDNGAMLPVGTLLQGGKYRIERYLSSGGFGNTYVATNTEFEEQVAIKEFFMRGISDRNGDSVSVSVSNKTNVQQFTSQKEKFRKEARRLRKLRNPHIVAVHDLFEENGTAYYQMDLIKGESLSERMKRSGQPLGEAEVLQILDQVLDALGVVHALGLYHLDLKPANIMVDQTGRALLIDFGASKQMSAGDGYSVSTSSALAFTPGYAPLEQTEQNMKAFGPWTDLYALGATLYKLLTGLTPPSASEILMMTTPLLFPTPVSGKTQQLIAWMMKPRLDERPQSVSAVRQFLSAPQPAEEETRPVQPEPVKEETVVIEKPQPKPQPQPKPEPEPPVPTYTDEEPEGEESGNSKLWWGIGAGVVAAIVAAIVVTLFLLKGPAADSAVTDAVEQAMGQQVTNQTYTSPVKDGMGTYQYTGPIDEQGRPDGTGKAVFTNGDRYEGPFVQGVMKGEHALYVFKSGDRFEGEMRNDQFFDGRYTSADGSYFIGSFYKGQPEHGVWYDKNGKKLTEM